MKRAIVVGLVACAPAATAPSPAPSTPLVAAAEAPPASPRASAPPPALAPITQKDVDAAGMACAHDAATACMDLASISTTPGATLEACRTKCQSIRETAKNAREKEVNRPKTKASSIQCFGKCMSDCSGGRIKVRADGTYQDDPDEWCGYCDVNCHDKCDVRRETN